MHDHGNNVEDYELRVLEQQVIELVVHWEAQHAILNVDVRVAALDSVEDERRCTGEDGRGPYEAQNQADLAPIAQDVGLDWLYDPNVSKQRNYVVLVI